MNLINSIISPVSKDLKIFNERFNECISAEGFFIDNISSYVFSKKGKQIRPLITLLTAKMLGEVTERTIRSAIILELLHTASLIHDDVIDQSEKRRGTNTLNFVWGNNTAVLFGDYIYGKCLDQIETQEDFDLVSIYAKIGKALPLGELLQKEVSDNLDYTEDSYFKVINNKTAALMEASAEIGAITSGGIEFVDNLKRFGFYLGIAFQIKDDIMDLRPELSTGKSYGNDIREKKITLPIIYYIKDQSKADRDGTLKFINKEIKTEEEINSFINLIRDKGYLEKAEKEVEKFCDKARKELDVFADSEEKRSLVDLISFLIVRNN